MLLNKVFRAICNDFGWRFESVLRLPHDRPDQLPPADVIFCRQSLIDLERIRQPFRAIHIVRDPRDVVVSGYLYHRRCDEKWCTNDDFDLSEPILAPRVPPTQEHLSEAWKREYLRSLGGRSYQQHLQDLPQDEGLTFELERFGSWTIDAMASFPYRHADVLEFRFESLMGRYATTFDGLFGFFGFNAAQVARAHELATVHDLSAMDDERVQRSSHITSRNTTRWARYLDRDHLAALETKFGATIERLYYPD